MMLNILPSVAVEAIIFLRKDMADFVIYVVNI